MTLRLANFEDALNSIKGHNDPNGDVPQHLHERIVQSISGHEDRWQELFEIAHDVEILFCPLQFGLPTEEVSADDLGNKLKSIPEILIEHVDELSSDDFFNCEPSVWFGIVAADLIATGLFMYRMIQHSLTTYPDKTDPDLEKLLPVHVASTYGCGGEALIAGEVFKRQAYAQIEKRRLRASKGGIERNRKYSEARIGFVEFYLAHRNLSRAEAARRYYRNLIQALGPGERRLYISEESAVRAFTEALRKENI